MYIKKSEAIIRRKKVAVAVNMVLNTHLGVKYWIDQLHIFPHMLKNRFETTIIDTNGVVFRNGGFFEVPSTVFDQFKCLVRLIQTGTKPLSYFVLPVLKSLVPH